MSPNADKDAGTWKRLEQINATLTFKCVCGGEVEIDLEAGDLDGATQVGDLCDDCGTRLLIYADVDVRTRVTPGRGDV